MDNERFKRFIAVMIALVTTFAAILAYLQSTASALDDRANRDTKLYSVEALGFKVAGDARSNFEFNTVYQAWDELDTLMVTSEEEPAREQVYEKVRDGVAKFSPLFDAKGGYFDKKEGAPDYGRFEAETYIKDLETLVQKYKAASVVKDAYDGKANAYIVHLTLLAVALFLFGLSLTVHSRLVQRLFAAVGMTITLVSCVWAFQTWAAPVFDLRDHPKAIEAYAKGMALSHRGMEREAAAEFDQAVKEVPEYGDALAARADSYYSLEKYPESIADLQSALKIQGEAPHLFSKLGAALYELGRFDEAATAYRSSLLLAPDELHVRFSLALDLLAAGQLDEAQKEYQDGLQRAAALVAKAEAEGLAAPGDVWEALDEASADVDTLCETIRSGEGTPPRDKIQKGEQVLALNEKLVGMLDGMSTALEYTGKPPQGTLAAKIGDLYFGVPEFDENGEVASVVEDENDEFEAGTSSIAVDFDYEGMKDGQDVVLKIFRGSTEEPSWRIVDKWSLGASGSAEYVLTPGYTDTFAFPADTYTVEIFVDGHMANRSSFAVLEEE